VCLSENWNKLLLFISLVIINKV